MNKNKPSFYRNKLILQPTTMTLHQPTTFLLLLIISSTAFQKVHAICGAPTGGTTKCIASAATAGTFTGDAFTSYNFDTNPDETLTVIVDGSDVAITLDADCSNVATAAGLISIAGATIAATSASGRSRSNF